MAFSQGSRTRLSYIEEVTFGTTPAGNFQEVPFETHSLNLTKERVQGNDIQSDRMNRVDRHGNKSTAGDIAVSLRNGAYDAFLESLMFSTWDASPVSLPDELKVGTTLKSFSIEDYAADIDQARLFTGMAVSQASFSIAPNQLINTVFSFVGSDHSISATEKTIDAAGTDQPFDAYSGDLQIADAGGTLASAAIVTSIEFTVNNSLAPTFVVGSDATPQLEYGRADVEGTITAYYQDADLINRFINETETQLFVTVNDPSAANQYGFYFPKIKVNGADVPVQNEQSRLITIPFVALYDATEGSNFTITRPDST
jgi:hypothetical protein